MMLNLTILAQIIHFFVVYQIMVRLFFRPAWREMQKDRDYDRTLGMAVLAAEEVCRVKRQRVEQERASFAMRLKNLMPAAPTHGAVIPETPFVRISPKSFDQVIKTTLVNTITHVIDSL